MGKIKEPAGLGCFLEARRESISLLLQLLEVGFMTLLLHLQSQQQQVQFFSYNITLISSSLLLHLRTLMITLPPANAGDVRDVGSVPGLGRSLGGGHGNLLQGDRRAWWATVHGVAKSQT